MVLLAMANAALMVIGSIISSQPFSIQGIGPPGICTRRPTTRST
jgi:hypothetical protein